MAKLPALPFTSQEIIRRACSTRSILRHYLEEADVSRNYCFHGQEELIVSFPFLRRAQDFQRQAQDFQQAQDDSTRMMRKVFNWVGRQAMSKPAAMRRARRMAPAVGFGGLSRLFTGTYKASFSEKQDNLRQLFDYSNGLFHCHLLAILLAFL